MVSLELSDSELVSRGLSVKEALRSFVNKFWLA